MNNLKVKFSTLMLFCIMVLGVGHTPAKTINSVSTSGGGIVVCKFFFAPIPWWINEAQNDNELNELIRRCEGQGGYADVQENTPFPFP